MWKYHGELHNCLFQPTHILPAGQQISTPYLAIPFLAIFICYRYIHLNLISRGLVRSVIPVLILVLHQSSTWNLLGHWANPKKPRSLKADIPDVASAVYMPECSCTARILDHSGVGLQGVAQLIYNSKTSPSTSVFLNQPLRLATWS